jgi:hypothetical protein
MYGALITVYWTKRYHVCVPVCLGLPFAPVFSFKRNCNLRLKRLKPTTVNMNESDNKIRDKNTLYT